MPRTPARVASCEKVEMATTIRNYRIPSTGFCTVYHYANSQSNRLPNGRVNTQVQSPLDFQHCRNSLRIVGDFNGSKFDTYDAQTAGTIYPDSYSAARNRLYAEARARFDGKLRSGHADLGVTLGSWKQSWDMIAKRAGQASSSLDRAHRRLSERLNNSQRLEQHRRLHRRDRELKKWIGGNNSLETPANLVLETEFGWVPLIQDAAKAFRVMTKPCPNGWVTGRAKTHIYETGVLSGNPRLTRTWSGKQQCTLSSNVWVDNPNLWLLNQMGLLNLPGVSWDLVPWSFVANMFTNLGQIANSFTSYYGLRMNNTSVTHSVHYLIEANMSYAGSGSAARSSNVVARRDRSLGVIPPVPFVFRMPELNMETALIAVSLAVQQVSRITKLLS
uniref:Maturation n=1 Tax=Leviviridae sp. TaxID=2027243 RepID=A0A514DCT4_9VIRU|nr:MAG: hypothetical protein H1Rhizo25885e4861_000003 [Leviviridae sp.]